MNKCGNQIDFAEAIVHCVLRFFSVPVFYLLLLLVIFFNFWINQLDWHNRNQHAATVERTRNAFLCALFYFCCYYHFRHFIAFYIERIFKLFVEMEAPWIMNDSDKHKYNLFSWQLTNRFPAHLQTYQVADEQEKNWNYGYENHGKISKLHQLVVSSGIHFGQWI